MLKNRLLNSGAFFAPETGDGGGDTTQAPAVDNLYPNGGQDAPQADVEAKADASAPDDKAPAEAKPEADAKPEAEAEAKPIELKLPEGVEFNEEAVNSFKELAEKSGLTAEAAQNLFDLYVGEMKALSENQTKAWNDTIKNWESEIDKLPDFNTAEKRDAAQVVIGKALDEYGSPEAREAFDLTGAGWNPHIVNTFYKMAKALSEGGPVSVGNPAGRQTSAAERLYPNHTNGAG